MIIKTNNQITITMSITTDNNNQQVESINKPFYKYFPIIMNEYNGSDNGNRYQ